MRFQNDAALVLVVATETDRAIDISDNSVVLRTTGFEQLGNAWQTTGNIFRFRTFIGTRARTSPAETL